MSTIKYRTERGPKDRGKNLDELMALLNESQATDAIDRAIRHTLESIETLENVKEEVPPQLARKLSTSEVSLAHYAQVKTK